MRAMLGEVGSVKGAGVGDESERTRGGSRRTVSRGEAGLVEGRAGEWAAHGPCSEAGGGAERHGDWQTCMCAFSDRQLPEEPRPISADALLLGSLRCWHGLPPRPGLAALLRL